MNRRSTLVLPNKRIKSQMIYGVTMTTVIVLALSAGALNGALKFRKVTKSIRTRAHELPLASDLSQGVSDLRVSFSKLNEVPHFPNSIHDRQDRLINFNHALDDVRYKLENYRIQLEQSETSDPRIADNSLELSAVTTIGEDLEWISRQMVGNDWILTESRSKIEVEEKLTEIQEQASELPKYLKQRMDAFAAKARTEYHTWITLNTIMTVGAVVLSFSLVMRFRRKIFRPLELLLTGSRQVAQGNYRHRIQLQTNDEMAELADAFNDMTTNFAEIKDELDQQVRQRTKEVVRSEQLASVGFLAAGVAHEINNPLASIAWSAESLESRLHDILNPDKDAPQAQRDADIKDMQRYLKRIQDEAFRCKGITSSLLDFSRLGDVKKSPTDMRELIEGVVDIVRPLSRYRDKQIVLNCQSGVRAIVNAQEIKQVVLNLVTNSLDNMEPGGKVVVDLVAKGGSAEITVTDDGCGMDREVLEHIFEPFFTRRRDGQGTGLGLSITYRILEEHDGTIRPYSEGPGQGSRFTVTLPLAKNEQQRLKAA